MLGSFFFSTLVRWFCRRLNVLELNGGVFGCDFAQNPLKSSTIYAYLLCPSRFLFFFFVNVRMYHERAKSNFAFFVIYCLMEAMTNDFSILSDFSFYAYFYSVPMCVLSVNILVVHSNSVA